MGTDKENLKKSLKEFLKYNLDKFYQDNPELVSHLPNDLTIAISESIDNQNLQFKIRRQLDDETNKNHKLIVSNYLRKYVIQKNNHIQYSKEFKDKDFFKDEFFYFLINYLISYGVKIKITYVSKIIEIFLKFIDEELGYSFYITPILNFNAEFDELKLKHDIWIRKIKPEELSKFQDELPKGKLSPKIHYTIVKKIKITQHDEDYPVIAKEEFEWIIAILNLMKKGNSTFGPIFSSKSEIWTEKIDRVSQFMGTTPWKNQIQLNEIEKKKFRSLFLKLDKFTKGRTKNDFIQIAISRFNAGIRENSISNAIVDFVISIESLLVGKEGESTLRLSLRTAMLNSESDERRIKIKNFIQDCYNYRSGVLHEGEQRKIAGFSIQHAKEELMMYNREFILNIIKLVDQYSNKDEIGMILDESLMNRNLDNKLKKIFKKSII